MRLFSWFILRRLLHEPLRSVTTALGIALGVAVIIAIQLTNASSLAGFETALDTVSGQTSLEIVGTGLGIDERRLPELGWLRAFGPVSPVLEGDVTSSNRGRPNRADCACSASTSCAIVRFAITGCSSGRVRPPSLGRRSFSICSSIPGRRS